MLTRHHDPARADERGATMVILALFLTVMLGLSALVVDLGAARHEKRKAQNLSDSASLAAAQELGDSTQEPLERMVDATNQAMAYVQRQQPTPPDNWPTWAAAWQACTDPNHLEVESRVVIPGGGSECISFAGPDATISANDIPARVRVRVPDLTVTPYFSQAIGVNNTVVSAAATAAVASSSSAFQGRLILPIAHGPDTDGTSDGIPWILRLFRWFSSSPTSGHPLIYDDSNLNTWDRSCREINDDSTAACVLQSPRLSSFTSDVGSYAPNALKVNLAMGLDHDLGTYPPGSPKDGPPTRVCDLNALPASAPTPCSTTNVYSGSVANHVITAQGRRWNWIYSLLCLLGCWEEEDLPSMDDWQSAVDQGLALGDDSAGSFTQGSTTFCARLTRPNLTEDNYNQPQPGGTCTPASPTTTLTVNCGFLCTKQTTINGRHIARYMSATARAHFWGDPGGSNSGCDGDPVSPDPNPFVDNVDDPDWTRDGGWFSSAESGATRLGWYLTQSEANPYPCNTPPPAPIFDAEITRDPRFAWITVVQSDCNSAGSWDRNSWDWSFQGGGFDWDRDQNNCAVGDAKYVLELRAVFIDTIEVSCCFLSDAHIDKVYAWEFDPALIEPWTSIGPATSAPIAYQGGPVTPFLEN